MTSTNLTLDPRFFDLGDIRAVQGRSWIPLRQEQPEDHESPIPGVGGVHTYSGVATLAVAADDRATVDAFGWSDVDVSTHRPNQDDGVYRPVDLHYDWGEKRKAVGVRLVLAQHIRETDQIWRLHPDVVIALKLEREGDSWFRPDEGWAEVARLKHNKDGRPVLLEMRAEMLSDYLAARRMALFLSSYHERAAFFEARPPYPWVDEPIEETVGRDSRERYIATAEFPPERRFHYRGLGALWRTEWFEPGTTSIRVRGDEEPGNVTFAVGTSGERKSATECVRAMTYLAFEPALVPALLRYRSGSLGWYSRDTGGIGAATNGVHFGVNHLGLITIFAKDIANLDGWEQPAWAAHSVALDGGVSTELFDTQMNCKPASTRAPETQIAPVLKDLNTKFEGRFGAPLLRDNEAIGGIVRRAHRFRAVEHDGLLALAKDLSRLLMERMDIAQLRSAAETPAKDKLGSLKALERLLEKAVSGDEAREMMAPLFGIYDLRNADAHLGSSLEESGFQRSKVDRKSPLVDQGRQLLEAFVETVRSVATAIDKIPNV